MSDPLHCPQCHRDDQLGTIERLDGVAECAEITAEGPEFTGETEVIYDTSETVGVQCQACYWDYIGEDWIKKLATS